MTGAFALGLAACEGRQFSNETVSAQNESYQAGPSMLKNGSTASPRDFLFMANLISDRGQECAGALIARRWILTAAHCLLIDPYNPLMGYKKLQVVMGHQTFEGVGGVKLPIRKMMIHPQYRWPRYDVGLIQLELPILNVRPVRVADRPLNFSAQQVGTFAGWGLVDHEGRAAQHLQVAQFEIASATECAQHPAFLSEGWKVTDEMICIRTPRETTTCRGDSGGPLVQTRAGQQVVIGVSSWGSGCRARKHEPYQGFIDVSDVAPWIQLEIQKFELLRGI